LGSVFPGEVGECGLSHGRFSLIVMIEVVHFYMGTIFPSDARYCAHPCNYMHLHRSLWDAKIILIH
jgi:hypothetical protein